MKAALILALVLVAACAARVERDNTIAVSVLGEETTMARKSKKAVAAAQDDAAQVADDSEREPDQVELLSHRLRENGIRNSDRIAAAIADFVRTFR